MAFALIPSCATFNHKRGALIAQHTSLSIYMDELSLSGIQSALVISLISVHILKTMPLL